MRLSLLIIFVGLLLSNCSDNPSKSTFEQVNAEISNSNLDIANYSEATIYYFAIDQDFAAKANWSTKSTEENAIKSMDIKKLPLSEVAGYKPDNKIILYYWTSKNPQQSEINHILVSK
ncbi:hypothetical protein [Fodinibius sp.]|uniref:hypothetical protein n=1 Tax=Fodinibius sp. TaxID=1872440 RepID=UPI002ACE032D|nr:hypothetical protein [Fodinibius sp.]MDZ7659473.1 hypothetical protein [Fodinibius sp.]